LPTLAQDNSWRPPPAGTRSRPTDVDGVEQARRRCAPHSRASSRLPKIKGEFAQFLAAAAAELKASTCSDKEGIKERGSRYASSASKRATGGRSCGTGVLATIGATAPLRHRLGDQRTKGIVMSVRFDHGEDKLDEVHEINVTPFIDVVLVLLIIFMVAAPLATVDIAVNLPA